MRTRLSIGIAVLGLLLAAVPAPAHHAFAAEFDIARPIVLRGTITKMEWINPHSWIHIDVKGPGDNVVSWMVEGGSPNALFRLGFTMESVTIGQELVVDGYQAKDGSNKAVGKSLTFPDGRRLFLGGSAPGGRGEPK